MHQSNEGRGPFPANGAVPSCIHKNAGERRFTSAAAGEAANPTEGESIAFSASSRPAQTGRWQFLAICGALLAFSPQLQALDPAKSIFQFNCQNWTLLNGLPAERVNAIAQSKDGYIWISSQKGLIQFDGVAFRDIPDAESGGQIASSISESKDGRVWLSLPSGDFGSIDGARFVAAGDVRRIAPGIPSTAFLAASDGAVWTGSALGWQRWGGDGPVDTSSQKTMGPVSSLSEDKTGRVWIGTAGAGLSYWSKGKAKPFADPEVGKAVVLSVKTDLGGDVWGATSQGLFRYDASFRQRETPNYRCDRALRGALLSPRRDGITGKDGSLCQEAIVAHGMVLAGSQSQ